MSTEPSGAEKLFEGLAREFEKRSGAEPTRRKGFGSQALWAGKKMFAFLDRRGDLVLKLPRDRVDALVADGMGKRWDPGNGMLQKEWLALDRAHASDWSRLAKDAQKYAASLAKPRKRVP